MNKKDLKVILPGSYDPVTVGHMDIVRRAAEEYGEVYVVAFINPNKKYLFSVSERVSMLMLACDKLDNVLVSYSDGLVIDYMREHGIDRIVKGYRNDADLKWEKEQAEWNLTHGGYPTELILCDERMKDISSTAVREALAKGRIPDELLPSEVAEYLSELGREK